MVTVASRMFPPGESCDERKLRFAAVPERTVPFNVQRTAQFESLTETANGVDVAAAAGTFRLEPDGLLPSIEHDVAMFTVHWHEVVSYPSLIAAAMATAPAIEPLATNCAVATFETGAAGVRTPDAGVVPFTVQANVRGSVSASAPVTDIASVEPVTTFCPIEFGTWAEHVGGAFLIIVHDLVSVPDVPTRVATSVFEPVARSAPFSSTTPAALAIDVPFNVNEGEQFVEDVVATMKLVLAVPFAERRMDVPPGNDDAIAQLDDVVEPLGLSRKLNLSSPLPQPARPARSTPHASKRTPRNVRAFRMRSTKSEAT